MLRHLLSQRKVSPWEFFEKLPSAEFRQDMFTIHLRNVQSSLVKFQFYLRAAVMIFCLALPAIGAVMLAHTQHMFGS